MFRQALHHCEGLSLLSALLYGLLLGLGIEALTAWMRFGLGLVSTRDTSALSALTFGFRIHHGYIGALLVLAAFLLLEGAPGWRNLVLMAGMGLLVSDLLHHFVVLWLATGSPEFDLRYPR